MRGSTPSQTVGPFFACAMPYPGGAQLVREDEPGAVRLAGVVRDGAGAPVDDALVEIWQADRGGRYGAAAGGFHGFGRSATDAQGRYAFLTVKPGVVAWADGRPQAPHILVCLFARGLLRHLYTRIYFPDEAAANAADPLLESIDDPALRSTLLARPDQDGIAFDIHLQGERQTAFLDV